MDIPDKKSDEEEIDVLRDIRGEIQNLSKKLARIDERTRNTQEEITRLREKRVIPVEKQAELNKNRGKRNGLILSAGLTTVTIVFSWALGVLPL